MNKRILLALVIVVLSLAAYLFFNSLTDDFELIGTDFDEIENEELTQEILEDLIDDHLDGAFSDLDQVDFQYFVSEIYVNIQNLYGEKVCYDLKSLEFVHQEKNPNTGRLSTSVELTGKGKELVMGLNNKQN